MLVYIFQIFIKAQIKEQIDITQSAPLFLSIFLIENKITLQLDNFN